MKIKFVPRDCWLGLQGTDSGWMQTAVTGVFAVRTTTWYLCLIPCFPIIWQTSKVIQRPS